MWDASLRHAAFKSRFDAQLVKSGLIFLGIFRSNSELLLLTSIRVFHRRGEGVFIWDGPPRALYVNTVGFSAPVEDLLRGDGPADWMLHKQSNVLLKTQKDAQDSRGTKGGRAECTTQTARTRCRQEQCSESCTLEQKAPELKANGMNGSKRWLFCVLLVFAIDQLLQAEQVAPLICRILLFVCCGEERPPLLSPSRLSLILLTPSFSAFDRPRPWLWPSRSLTNNLASVPLPKVPSLPLTLPQMPSFSPPAWMGPLCENTYVSRGGSLNPRGYPSVKNTQTWTLADPKTAGP